MLFAIKTFHKSKLCLNIASKKLVLAEHGENDELAQVYFESSDFNGGGEIFVIHSKIKLYLTEIKANFICELSTIGTKNFTILFQGCQISILNRNGFVSAGKDHQLSYKPWNRGWERFDIFPINNKNDTKHIIKLHYWNREFSTKYNFGDLLSKYIVEKVSQCKVEFSSLENNSFIAIGSMINRATILRRCRFWGTGVMHLRLNFIHGNKFFAVRGPLSRYTLISAGYECPDIYGDPALLLPKFYNPKLPKKYKLGVICHYHHQKLVKLEDGVKFINILRSEDEIHSFIDEVLQCEKIISSSLHGIIVANAYGIPAKWFIVNDLPLGGDPTKKFYDYFSSVQMPLQIPIIFKKDDFISEGYSKLIDDTVDLKINLDLLMQAFPYSEV
jgi:pyruvyltransferase